MRRERRIPSRVRHERSRHGVCVRAMRIAQPMVRHFELLLIKVVELRNARSTNFGARVVGTTLTCSLCSRVQGVAPALRNECEHAMV